MIPLERRRASLNLTLRGVGMQKQPGCLFMQWDAACVVRPVTNGVNHAAWPRDEQGRGH